MRCSLVDSSRIQMEKTPMPHHAEPDGSPQPTKTQQELVEDGLEKCRELQTDSKSSTDTEDFIEETKRNGLQSSTNEKKRMRPWTTDILASVSSGILLLSIYIRTVSPSLPGGDSGELIYAAHEFGVAHPPGYPLFTMMVILVIKFIPFGNIAYRMNCFSAALSSVAGSLVHLTTLRLTGSHGSGLFAMASFSLSRVVWRWSITAEVFSLNNLMISILLLLSVIFERTSDTRKLVKVAKLGAFACGLCLCNQHTSVIYVGVIALWVLNRLRNAGCLSPHAFLQLTLAFCTGLVPYVYLPVSTCLSSGRWTWGDHTTFEGFWAHITRAAYGTFNLATDSRQGQGFLYGMGAFVEHTVSSGWLIGSVLALIALGFIFQRAYRGGEQAPAVFFVMMLLYQGFFAWRANLDLKKPLLRGVVERFWIQSDIVISILSAIGLHHVVEYVWRKHFSKGDDSSKFWMSLGCAAAMTFLQLIMNFTNCDQSGNYMVRDYALTLMENIPKNSLVLTRGDLTSNSLRYLHLCENVRPDLYFIEEQFLSTRWMVPMLQYSHAFPKVTFPGDFQSNVVAIYRDGHVSFNMELFLNMNFNRFTGVYRCLSMAPTNISYTKSYISIPFGVCDKVLLRKSKFLLDQYATEMTTFGSSWKYPLNGHGLDESSWDILANKRVWEAKFYIVLPQNANELKVLQPSLLRHGNEEVPPTWHRMFAIICHKLGLGHTKKSQQDIDDVISRARNSGVVACLVCAETPSSCKKVMELYERYPGFCLPCLGVHPVQPVMTEPESLNNEERSVTIKEYEDVLPWVDENHERIVAVGEVGLDFTPRLCKNAEDKESQRLVLRKQVELAKKYDLPLNVHSRSAGKPTINLLKEAGAERVLMHAFDGRPAFAMEGVQAGFFFSIPPCVVRSEQKQKLVQRLPIENMVLETDSPVLGPVKQERNEPANIRRSCEYIAEVKKMDVETVGKIMYENSLKLFPRLARFLK